MHSVLEAIGNTPFINLEGIWIKLENMNPSGSIKDRIAKYIIEKAEKTGKLKKGYKVIEATSGNSGIAFSMVCVAKGYQMVVIMPKGMTSERTEILKHYGAKIIFTPKKEHVEGAFKKELQHKKHKGKCYPVLQFENEWNAEAHEKTLAKEILNELKRPDIFVAGVGTGGTLVGVGTVFRKKNKNCKLFAVFPKNKYNHKIEGIGDGFIPKLYADFRDDVDGEIRVTDKQAIDTANMIAKNYGIFVGPSSGANFYVAKQLKKKYSKKNVVTVFPDSGDRYLSEHF